jgi:hypothetical protein
MKRLSASKTRIVAQQERALLGTTLQSGMPLTQPSDIARVLTDMLAVAKKIEQSTSKTPVATVSKETGKLRLTLLGRDLVDALFNASQLLAVPQPTSHFDLRIEALAESVRRRRLFNLPLQSYDAMEVSPHQCADVLNGLADEYRTLATSRGFWRMMARHQDVIDDRLRRLKAYFDLTARRAPDASVLRLELRITDGVRGDRFDPYRIASSHWHWLKAAEELFDGGIAGQAFKIDCDAADGLFVHVVLVVEKVPLALKTNHLAILHASWRKVSSDARATLLNCKESAVPLEFRGYTDKEWPVCLREELHNAAVYLASTDSLYRWDFLPTCAAFACGPTPAEDIAWHPAVLRFQEKSAPPLALSCAY